MKLAWMPLVGSVSFAVSAQAAVVISEINYKPPTDGQDSEFVELLNTGSQAVDLTGWKLTGLDYTFEGGDSLAAGGYWVVASEPVDTDDTNTESFENQYGDPQDGLLDEFPYPVTDGGGGLKDGGEAVTVIDASGVTVDSFDYTGFVNPMRRTAERHSTAPNDFVVGSNANGTPGWTEYSLVAVPEPVSLLLVATPLVVLTRWRRR